MHNISIDATKANRVIKVRNFAITPIVVRGWILPPSDDLLTLYTWVTGEEPAVVPITMQDIVPYSTPVKHINSILQPWIYTDQPVFGIATTSKQVIPGSATGATNPLSLDYASRYVLEVVKGFNNGSLELFNIQDFNKLIEIHGEIKDILRRGFSRS